MSWRVVRRNVPGSVRGLMLVTLLALPGAVAADSNPEPVQGANYKLAFQYSRSNLQPFAYSTSVRPGWIGKTDSFWYAYRTSKGTTYYRVDPEKKTKQPLFDHVKLAAQLSIATKTAQDAEKLPLTRTSIDAAGKKIKFVVGEFQYEYEIAADKLKKLGKAPPARRRRRFRSREEYLKYLEERRKRRGQQTQTKQQTGSRTKSKKRRSDYRAFSPNRKAYVYAQKHNLYLVDNPRKPKPVQLIKDGVEDYSFGGSNDDKKARPRVYWSKDSNAFYVTRGDSRGVKELYLVDSTADPRPTLQKYKYPMPGEEKIRKSELYVFHRDTNLLLRVPPKWKDESYHSVHWGRTSEDLRFIRRDRLRRNVEVCSFNTRTGETKCLLADGFENAHISFQPVRYLKKSDEMIWWSERSGWGHFYLYDRYGTLKNAITSGAYRASSIVSVDEDKRQMYFYANGREKGENVYYPHLYRCNLDGSGLTLLDPGNGYHRSTLSPSKKYVVDNCSRIDMVPVSVLRDANGKKVMDLESTDVSRLEKAGWKLPETFTVKAADGVTELYGNMWKPFDFDPGKKYPIIAHVYPGPQQEGVSHTFSALSSQQELAQLGFIVIQVGHRGGSPKRSKAYHRYSYFNMRDFGLGDKKAAIEQLANRHAFIDIKRVGIYGHSGGGFMSAAALLQKPYNEFFKAAVASAGNHDNNIYNNSWAERYHGLKLVKVKKGENGKSTVSKSSTTASTTPPDEADEFLLDVDPEAAQARKPKSAQTRTRPARAIIPRGAGRNVARAVIPRSARTAAAKKTGVVKVVQQKIKTFDDLKFEIKVPTNAELAENLKGHLLLVHGEIDNNVHPANTMRLADALIKANKRFDMLILPRQRHGFGSARSYFTQRMWEFFAEHLLGDRQTGADIYDKKEQGR